VPGVVDVPGAAKLTLGHVAEDAHHIKPIETLLSSSLASPATTPKTEVTGGVIRYARTFEVKELSVPVGWATTSGVLIAPSPATNAVP
jgi:hypothetical protein